MNRPNRWTSAAATLSLLSMTLVAGVTLAPPAAAEPCTGNTQAPLSTAEDPAGWDFTSSGTAGHHEWVEGGLRIWTDEGAPGADQQVAARRLLGGDLTAPLIVPLADIGEVSWDMTPISGAEPGINLQIAFADDLSFAGTLVKESVREEWWGTRALPGVPAGPSSNHLAFGTLEEIVANSERPLVVTLVGFSLGSNAVGEAIVTSITANCTTWTFGVAPEPEPEPEPEPTPTPTQTAPTEPAASPSVPAETPTNAVPRGRTGLEDSGSSSGGAFAIAALSLVALAGLATVIVRRRGHGAN